MDKFYTKVIAITSTLPYNDGRWHAPQHRQGPRDAGPHLSRQLLTPSNDQHHQPQGFSLSRHRTAITKGPIAVKTHEAAVDAQGHNHQEKLSNTTVPRRLPSRSGGAVVEAGGVIAGERRKPPKADKKRFLLPVRRPPRAPEAAPRQTRRRSGRPRPSATPANTDGSQGTGRRATRQPTKARARVPVTGAPTDNVPAPFAHNAEYEFARILDFYGIDWQYEPRTFPLRWDRGHVTEAFSPGLLPPRPQSVRRTDYAKAQPHGREEPQDAAAQGAVPEARTSSCSRSRTTCACSPSTATARYPPARCRTSTAC